MRIPRTAALPGLFTALAGALLFLSALAAVAAQWDGLTTDGSSEADSQRVVLVRTVYRVDPGDHLRVTASWSPAMDPVLPHTRVLVVEGGEGRSYFAGREAAHVLHETQYPPGCTYRGRAVGGEFCPLDFRFVRPSIYGGKPHIQGLNGDLHNAVDIVLVTERPDGMPQRTWDDGRRAMERPGLGVEKADGAWVTVQTVAFFGAALAAGGAVAGIITWQVRRHPPQAPDHGEGDIEGLVILQAKAAGFLRMVRSSLRLAGGLLGAAGIGLLVALAAVLDAGEYEPNGWIEAGTMVVGLAVWLLALAVWVLQYRRVARELRRWDSTPAPL